MNATTRKQTAQPIQSAETQKGASNASVFKDTTERIALTLMNVQLTSMFVKQMKSAKTHQAAMLATVEKVLTELETGAYFSSVLTATVQSTKDVRV